jgi:hypothetical protein
VELEGVKESRILRYLEDKVALGSFILSSVL